VELVTVFFDLQTRITRRGGINTFTPRVDFGPDWGCSRHKRSPNCWLRSCSVFAMTETFGRYTIGVLIVVGIVALSIFPPETYTGYCVVVTILLIGAGVAAGILRLGPDTATEPNTHSSEGSPAID
jgi:hypothetical protein